MSADVRRIARFAIFGAVGFGIGGLITPLVIILGFGFGFQQTDIFQQAIGILVMVLAFPAWGAIGGLALGLALGKERRRIATLILWGSIGFLVAGLVRHFPNFLLVLLGGAFSGAALGFAFKDEKGKRIVVLAVAGAFGFLVSDFVPIAFIYSYALTGFIDGALLGAVIGFLDKGVKYQESPPIPEQKYRQ